MLTTHEELSDVFGQKPHIMKKLIRLSETAYDVRNGVYILDRKEFEKQYKKMVMKTSAQKKAAKNKKASTNKKKKAAPKTAPKASK